MNPQWIWYKNELTYCLYNKVMNRRWEKNVKVLTCWQLPQVCPSIKFSRHFTLEKTTEIRIRANGVASVRVDDSPRYMYDFKGTVTLPAGPHNLLVEVYNPADLPCLYVTGEGCESGAEWKANCGNGKWIPCECGGFYDEDFVPSEYKLPVRRVQPLSSRRAEAGGRSGMLYDFGKEMFAYPVIEGICGSGELPVNYGESEEEALDPENSEQSDVFDVGEAPVYTANLTKAFRYIFVPQGDDLPAFETISCMEEYYPLRSRAKFTCSDPLLNEIYKVAEYTLELTSREFFLDGLKRDRWVWAGDTLQSEWMTFYSFYDGALVKNTLVALLGKDKFEQHINGIMDYSFYVVLAVWEYYRYTGDWKFIEEVYPRVLELFSFCLGRTNANGFMQKVNGEWVFVDWADFPNDGELCAEQMLLYRAMKAVADMERLLGSEKGAARAREAEKLREKIEAAFWTEAGYAHDTEGSPITRYGNIFAVLFGLCTEKQLAAILNKVLLNDGIQAITTPYMKFYEMSALAELGRADRMLDIVKSYWGGMIAAGATTFWEAYDPCVKGAEQYAMYGRRFGKSLCHSWGASPIYLLGRYLVGLEPDEDGYKTFRLRPYIDGKTFFEAELPAGDGFVQVSYQKEQLRVYSSSAPGRLIAEGREYPISAGKEFVLGLGQN